MRISDSKYSLGARPLLIGALVVMSVMQTGLAARAFADGNLPGVGVAIKDGVSRPTPESYREFGKFRKYQSGGNNIYVQLMYRWYDPYSQGYKRVTANSNRWNDADLSRYSVTIQQMRISDSSLCEDRRLRSDKCS